MREATGNALLTMMMTSIIAIIMIFFVGSLSYSKAYKIKNYIVNEIEDNKGWDDNLMKNIDDYLKNAGYYVRTKPCSNTVSSTAITCNLVSNNSQYDYCVYSCGEGINKYYRVITHSKFEFPVVGSVVKFDVSGETEAFNDFN